MRRGAGVSVIDLGVGGHHQSYTPRILAAVATVGDVSVDAFIEDRLVEHVSRALARLAELPEVNGDAVGAIRIHALHPQGRSRSLEQARWMASMVGEVEGRGNPIIDLMGDRWVWGWPAFRDLRVAHTHVFHEVYVPRGGGDWLRSHMALMAWGASLNRLSRGRGRIVVHTQEAARQVRRFAPGGTVIDAHGPAWMGESAPPEDGGERGQVVFCGGIRRGRGFDTLVGALAHCRSWSELLVLSRPTSAANETTAGLEKPVRFEHLDDENWVRALRHAGVVVLPHDDEFRRKGGASGVLQEALANGAPVVVSESLMRQLPPLYDGALTFPAGNSRQLGCAIEAALQDREALAGVARTQGYNFARNTLSWFGYASVLLGELQPEAWPTSAASHRRRTSRRLVNRAKSLKEFLGAPPRSSLYVGWVGHGNLGDEVLWAACGEAMPQLDLRVGEPPYRRPLGAVARRPFGSVIVGGGTLLLEPYYLHLIEPQHRRGTPLAVFGSGARADPTGASRELRSRWQEVLSTAAYIGVRGEHSSQVLSELGIESEVIGDLACLTYGTQPPNRERRSCPAVAMNATQLSTSKEARRKLRALMDRLDQDGVRLVVLKASPEDDVDSFFLASGARQADVPIVRVDNLGELRRLAHSVDAVVGMRLHSTALAMAAGTPGIMLGYDAKCHEWMESVDAGEYWFDAWDFDVDEVLHRLGVLLNDPSQFTDRVLTRIAYYSELQRTRAAELVRMLTVDGVSGHRPPRLRVAPRHQHEK